MSIAKSAKNGKPYVLCTSPVYGLIFLGSAYATPGICAAKNCKLPRKPLSYLISKLYNSFENDFTKLGMNDVNKLLVLSSNTSHTESEP